MNYFWSFIPKGFITLFLCCLSVAANAQNWSELDKIVPDDRAANDLFGNAVAISGNYAIVSSNDNSSSSYSSPGAAYILYNDNGTWKQVKKISASVRASDDGYGSAVAISGDYAVVGAFQEDEDETDLNPITHSGSAYIYARNYPGPDQWGLVKKIKAPTRVASDNFGWSVAIDGDYVIVGATGQDSDASGLNVIAEAGAAYIFARNQGGLDAWGLVKKITASTRQGGASFGAGVAISGNYAIVGGHYEDASESLPDAGAAYIFEKNKGATDNWGFVTKITASTRKLNGNFGFPVSLSGKYAVVSASGEDGYTGSAYIFEQDISNPDIWTQVKLLRASTPTSGDFYGSWVSISGNKVIVGAFAEDEDSEETNTVEDAGSAYIYAKDQGGANSWGLVKKIVASDRSKGDNFGNAVAIDGNYAIVGANADGQDVNGLNPMSFAGSTYFFGDMTALPVTLESFHVTKNENEALLRWATSAETNTDYFEIQRSSNGKNWLALGEVAAAEESSSLLRYHFTDSKPKEGQNLYRLKMVDQDGTFAYSRIQNLSFDENVVLNAYPNPASNTLYLRSAGINTIKSVQISDMTGHTVLTANMISEQGIAIASLAPGMYVVRIKQANESVVYKKLVVAK